MIYYQFVEEDSKAERDGVVFPGSKSKEVVTEGCELRLDRSHS